MLFARFQDFSNGVNKADAPIALASNELISGTNMELAKGGVWLRGRGGQTNLNSPQIDANPIRSLHRFYQQTGTGITVATSGTKIYKISDAGVVTDITGALVLAADKKFRLVNWSSKDKVYMTNGVQAMQSWDGVAASVSAVGGSPPITPWIEYHQGRLWAINGNLIQYTDLETDNSWPAANALNVSDRWGGTPQWVWSLGNVLVIAKDTGIYRFVGSPVLGGELQRFSDIGSVNRFGSILAEDKIIFPYGDGIYATNGFEVILISGRINPEFTSFFRTSVGGWYHGKRQYFFSYSLAGGANDKLWIGQEIAPNRFSWFPWEGFKAESFSNWIGSNDSGQMFYGRSDGGTVRRMDTGNQDIGVDYTCSLQLPWTHFGDPGVEKQVRWLKPVFDATKNTTFSLAYDFGKIVSGGQIIGEPSTVNWSAPWNASWGTTLVSNKRTSVLSLQSGRHVSIIVSNTGDGSRLKFYGISLEARIKEKRHYDIFALGTGA